MNWLGCWFWCFQRGRFPTNQTRWQGVALEKSQVETAYRNGIIVLLDQVDLQFEPAGFGWYKWTLNGRAGRLIHWWIVCLIDWLRNDCIYMFLVSTCLRNWWKDHVTCSVRNLGDSRTVLIFKFQETSPSWLLQISTGKLQPEAKNITGWWFGTFLFFHLYWE